MKCILKVENPKNATDWKCIGYNMYIGSIYKYYMRRLLLLYVLYNGSIILYFVYKSEWKVILPNC